MADVGAGQGPGQLRLTVKGMDGEAHLRSLQQWLACDDELRGRVTWQYAPPAPGHMGGTLTALTVILGSGGIAGLIAPLCTWFTSRRPDVAVSLELGDGRKVSIDVKRATDQSAVLHEAQELFRSLDSRNGQGE
ncbi:effector-associated constant component EACC1 [Streptomyces gilvosporeus]|uniref:Uncharacterized protein n=1 Tax=Streptomyces gilvosporeus TaxID=553510 RepID=A0A1V0U0A2_9ACTN|nr:hypothetical protein [Streptomyces gilvosporeus]ARF58649.1 hypothetical protein B1H19_34680 [Streptomyces gilvosporeus]